MGKTGTPGLPYGQQGQRPNNTGPIPAAVDQFTGHQQPVAYDQHQPAGTQDFGGGGGGSKKSAPPPPDYYGAAQATSQGNQSAINQQTQSNRPDQKTGFGSESWTQGPDGKWTQNTQLNGPLSGALSGLQGQAANNAQNGPQNSLQAQNQAISANYNQAASRLNPQWAQRDEQTQNQLINQGLDPNSQAYGQAMTSENQARNDAYSSAMNNAIGQGNQTAQVQMQEQMSPYQQMNALQGYQNGLPGFNAAGAYQGPNYLGAAEAAGNYGLQGSQMQNSMNQNQMQGWGSMISNMSDERVKKNVERLDVDALPGIPFATYQYKHAPGTTHLGVIAQDVEKERPDLVQTGPDGLKRVHGALGPFFSTREK